MKKTLFRGLLGAALTILVCLPAASRGKGPKKTREFTDADFRTEKILEALPIRATFLDEVSWDIPHQNWGVKEWDADFKYGMDFWFGTYDSCYHWHVGEYEKEIELNMQLIDEVWAKYGHHKSFRGWYLSQEISRRTRNVSKIYAAMGRHAKEISGGLKTMISPYIHGVKTDQVMAGDKAITVEEHRREWDAILSDIAGAVDILAFQDGQVDYDELYDYLVVNRELAERYGMECWTNVESFDRDMPIRFLPIKWEKLLFKLDAARRAGMQNVITFEFSHFMSPNSSYTQAGHLYNRYMEYMNYLQHKK